MWLPILGGDDRSAVDPSLMPDVRVTQYWDSGMALGTWFPQQRGYESITFGPVAWDTFFLYGPEAQWTDIPEPLIGSGRTVIGKRGDLYKNLLPMLPP